MTKKLFKKLVTFVVALQFLNYLILPMGVFAQDASPTPDPTPTETPIETSTPEPTETPSETETPSPSPTETPTPSPDPTNSPEHTDESSPTPSPDPSISPTPDPSETPSPTPDVSESILTADSAPSPDPTQVSQTGSSTTQTSAESNSGTNTQSGGVSQETNTGNSQAVANSVTIVNLSEINSNLIISVQNIYSSDTPDIDLYNELLAAIISNPNLIPANSNIVIVQNAALTSDTEALANSGENSQTGVSSTLTTGQAAAIANAFAAGNINLVGSNFIIAIINILGDYEGDIILPNSEVLTPQGSDTQDRSNISVTQSSETGSTTTSNALSGQNTQNTTGSAILTTGDSNALASSVTISNITQVGGYLTFLVINNLGDWVGSLVNWFSPGVSQSFDQGSFILTGESAGATPDTDSNSTISVTQNSQVSSSVNSVANTGGNSQEGHTLSMTTGSSQSIANNFVLGNTTSIGGGIFIGIINILGRWRGNIINAYPELLLDLTDNADNVAPGSELTYKLTVKNTGRANARQVNLKFNWPNILIPDSAENTSWELGNLAPDEIRIFTLTGRVSSSAPEGENIIASAQVHTPDTQSSSDANIATDTTTVLYPDDPPPDSRTPNLGLTVWNNTGEFVYPGDTVLVKIKVINNSAYPARNIKITSGISLKSEVGPMPMNWDIGNLRPGGKAEVSFSMNLASEAEAGAYTVAAQASGESDSGSRSVTDTIYSDFKLRSKAFTGDDPQVLGLIDVGDDKNNPPPITYVNSGDTEVGLARYYLYIFLGLTLTYILIKGAKRKLQGVPLVSPVILDFAKRKRLQFASMLFTMSLLIIVFLRKKVS